MNHKFFILENAEILNEPRWFLNDEVSKNSLILNDNVISNNPLFFKGFESFKVSLKNAGEGLDYYGITIIPSKGLDNFIENLSKVTERKVIPKTTTIELGDDNFNSNEIKITPLMHKQLIDIIALAKEAKEKDLYLIHFGL